LSRMKSILVSLMISSIVVVFPCDPSSESVDAAGQMLSACIGRLALR